MARTRLTREEWAELRRQTLARDRHRCMAPELDPDVAPESCRDRWGRRALATIAPLAYHLESLTLDHVHLHAGGTKGAKAPDDVDHLVTLCWFHHLEGWATSHRELERAYLQASKITVDEMQQPY